MDLQTQDYYCRRAAELARRYDEARGGIADWFDRAFPQGGSVLDVGAGSGRDLHRLLLDGWDGWGVEPCRALIDEAQRLYPAIRGRIRESSLPDLEGIKDKKFDGVVASAVLMHLTNEELEPSLCSVRRVLREGGRFLVSLPVDEKGIARRGRDGKGRFFNGLSPKDLEKLLTELGFICLWQEQSADGLGRKNCKWVIQLFGL